MPMNDKTESFGLLADGLAHDYNNILTTMLGNIDLVLADDSLNQDAHEAVADVRTSIMRASDLVHRVFAYVGNSEPVSERIDVAALLRDLARLMRRALPDTIRLDVDANGEASVTADATQLWRVVMNLVVNARDALAGREGTIRMVCASCDSPAKDGLVLTPGAKSAKWVEVIVADDGPGMDVATASRIFDPRFTTKKEGNGLGLASVMAIVRSYGGAIALKTAPGAGAEFRITLPCDASAVATDAGSVADAGSGHGDGAGTNESEEKPAPQRKAILVVDDDASILKLLGIILRNGGHDVVTASSGEEGLATYRASPARFSMALVDAAMGLGMDGIGMCAEIRRDDAAIPLVLMSAYRAKEMAGKMTEAGISRFLAKPFRGSDVLEMVASLTGGDAVSAK